MKITNTTRFLSEIAEALRSEFHIEKLARVEFKNWKLTRLEGEILSINSFIYLKLSDDNKEVEIYNSRTDRDWFLFRKLEMYTKMELAIALYKLISNINEKYN